MQRRKIYLLPLLLLTLTLNTLGQQAGINDDGSLPNPNAILDVKSSSKGVLLPRMSTANRLAIPNTKGLIVYDTTTNSFWYNTGDSWQRVNENATTGKAWLLGGNDSTTDNDFLGTIDDRPLKIKVMNRLSGLIDQDNFNTFWGFSSGFIHVSRDSGYYNTGIGAFSLDENTSGNFNTALGYSTMNSNKSGGYNTGIGTYSFYSNTTGNYNTATGYQAFAFSPTGHRNTALGAFALNRNHSGSNNSSIGYGTMAINNNGSNNTTNGYSSLRYNFDGSYNTATGSNALERNENGNYNTASGSFAMQLNSTGSSNTATGTYALYVNTNGYNNTAGGASSLYNNTSGYYNTAIGSGSMLSNKDGFYNTALGAYAMPNTQSGNYNTAVGYYSLQAPVTGTSNTAIGSFSNVLAQSSTTNSTALGSGAFSNLSNKVRIGNAAVTRIEGQVSFTTPSDGRFKYEVQDDVKGLDFILQLHPVTYKFDTEGFDKKIRGTQQDSIMNSDANLEAAYAKASAIRRSGFIAQEVEKAAQKANYNFSGLLAPKGDKDYYSISYESFVVPVVKAIQELNTMIAELKKENALLKTQLSNIKQ